MFDKMVARKWISALVMALGLGVAWGVGAALIGAIGGSLLPSTPGTYEEVVVAPDGTPIIQARIGGNYYNTNHRTLDGETLDLETNAWLGQASIGKPYRKPRWFESPIHWGERIAGISGEQKPPMSWIAVRDAKRPGHAYLAGYDITSKLCIGYIGREGSRPSIPARDEWFDLGHRTLSWAHRPIVSRNQVNYGGPGYFYGSTVSTDKNRLAYGLAFLIDGEKVQEIDLGNRRVRTVASLEGLQTLAILTQPLPSSSNEPEAGTTDQPTDESAESAKSQSLVRLTVLKQILSFQAVAPSIDGKHKTTDRLLARCGDQLVVINPFDSSQQAFSLPEQLRAIPFSAYSVAEDRLLLTIGRGQWESGHIVDLLWIDTEGALKQEKTLRLLSGHSPENPLLAAAAGSVVAPTLLPWVAGAFAVMPVGALNNYQFENYGEVMKEALPMIGPALVFLFGLSVVFTRLVFKWQRKYCRENTVLWCVTVFLFTWPGLMAYWVMHRRPVMEACGECHAEVPRDRDACARCKTLFAEPGRLGTEVFA